MLVKNANQIKHFEGTKDTIKGTKKIDDLEGGRKEEQEASNDS